MSRPKISWHKNRITIMNKEPFLVVKRTQKDYTLAVKLQVVEEAKSGHLSQKVQF